MEVEEFGPHTVIESFNIAAYIDVFVQLLSTRRLLIRPRPRAVTEVLVLSRSIGSLMRPNLHSPLEPCSILVNLVLLCSG